MSRVRGKVNAKAHIFKSVLTYTHRVQQCLLLTKH